MDIIIFLWTCVDNWFVVLEEGDFKEIKKTD